jgi:hypothetical protein
VKPRRTSGGNGGLDGCCGLTECQTPVCVSQSGVDDRESGTDVPNPDTRPSSFLRWSSAAPAASREAPAGSGWQNIVGTQYFVYRLEPAISN